MNENELLAEQIIKCLQHDIKNLTVFFNIQDMTKVKELVDAINGCLFKAEKDLFVVMLASDIVEPGKIFVTSKEGL